MTVVIGLTYIITTAYKFNFARLVMKNRRDNVICNPDAYTAV